MGGILTPALQNFLLDIDGPLVDSRAVVEDVWRELAARFGVDADAVVRACHGRRDEEVVADFFPSPVRAEVLGRVAFLEQESAWRVSPMPGAKQFLAELQPGSWAAVTSGSRRLMTARLRGAGLPVPQILVAAEDVRRGKPDPEGFVAAARRLGVRADRCVVVEDSPVGVEAGVAAGAFVIGLAGTHDRQALAAAGAVVGTLAEVVDVLRERDRQL